MGWGLTDLSASFAIDWTRASTLSDAEAVQWQIGNSIIAHNMFHD